MLASRLLPLLLSASTLLTAGAAPAAPSALEVTSATTSFSPGVRGELERIVAGHRGVMGICVKNVKTGEQISINGSEPFPTASTIKLAVMTTAFDRLARGAGPFRDYYDTRVYDAASSASGSGFLRQFREGSRVELKELLHFMITVSDNTATNMLVEWMDGLDPVNDWLKEHGFTVTRMNSTIGGRIIADREGRRTWGLGVTTPDEMGRLMEMILNGEAGTTSTTDEMLRLLGHQYFDGGIASQVPPTAWVGSKSGSVNDSRSDVAIVASPGGTYILSVYTKENKDQRWTRENEAEKAIQAVSRAVWKHFNSDSLWSRPSGCEAF